jgi:Flp pilus assembly protein TadD
MARYELKDSDYSFNASLDPFLVLKRMGFTESSIYQEGGIVRIHCPIHKDLVRKSMIIDTEERTYKCQYSQCDAYEGGLLVELVAMFYDCQIDEVTKHLFGEDDKSNDLLFRGEMFINKGMHEEALPYLEQAVQLDPRNEVTRCKLSALYLELNRKDDAFREYMLAAESFAVKGELEKTLSIYNILIILQPGAVKARKELAYLFARMGRPDAAAEQLKWVVDFYMQYGQVRGALEAINSILELAPENGMTYYLQGIVLAQTGKRGPAGQSFEKGATILMDAGEISRARMSLDQAQEVQPSSPSLRVLKQRLSQLEAEEAKNEKHHAHHDDGSMNDEEANFMDWLAEVDDKLGVPVDQMDLPMDEPIAGVAATGGVTETTEISPEDRRVALCLGDMRNLTPDQLEKMRQQLISMFTDVRKTYEEGLLSEWEMRTIKDFYKAFCVAVDQHRKNTGSLR